MRWMAAGAIRWYFVFFSHLQDWRRRSLDRAGSCWRRLPGLGLHGDAGRGWCDSVDLTWASLTPANPSADRDHAAASSSTSTSWLMKTTGFVPIRTKSWDQEIVDQLDQPRPLSTMSRIVRCALIDLWKLDLRSSSSMCDSEAGAPSGRAVLHPPPGGRQRHRHACERLTCSPRKRIYAASRSTVEGSRRV
jgi:hypothetical protein